ncbi:MAG: apolipoprotein N-acyltransferase, partial [Halanaerobiales bacterium]
MVYLSYILVILSGLLISVAFFFPKFFILGLIGLVPFLFAIKRDKPAQGFIKGLLLGIIISIMTASWLYYPLFEIAGLPLTLTILLMVIVYLILSFFYGLFTLVYLYIKGSKKFSPFCFAVCWTGIEYLRFRIVSAFPFGFMAYTQTDFYPLIQFAEVGGIFLISFILFLVNSYFYQLLSNKKLRFLVSLIIIFAVIMTYGTIRINKFENNEYEMLDVGVIQTILSPEAKRNPANIEVNMNSLVDKSASLSGVELIVWPESALKFDFIRNEYYRKKFDNKIKNINKYLQVGSIAVREDDMNLYGIIKQIDLKGG